MIGLRFDGRVVVVTGAGAGLGKAYALSFASRGASVVVNDLGGSLKGAGRSTKAADLVVNEIIAAGGKAVASYDSVENGEAVIDTAIKAFGRVDILVNNAGVLRDLTFRNMKKDDWDLVLKIHLTGAYSCSKAAWPYFQTQRYGRIINTISSAGLYGNFGQANYCSAKSALVGFTQSLATEGIEYNILVNAVGPAAASRMTQTIMPQNVLDRISPGLVAPIISVLAHSSNTTETGAIFEAGGGYYRKTRWERSRGAFFESNAIVTPSSIIENWPLINDFSSAMHPKSPATDLDIYRSANARRSNDIGGDINFAGKVILVTGAATALGQAGVRLFSKLGASVIAADHSRNIQKVADEICSAHGNGKAEAMVACHIGPGDSDGTAVRAAIDGFGKVDGLFNAVDFPSQCRKFSEQTEQEWNDDLTRYLHETFTILKAVWPYFIKQKFGRVVNTASPTGLYGSPAHASCASVSLGIVGLSRCLAMEGSKYNIHLNTVAPYLGPPQSNVTDFAALVVASLCTDKITRLALSDIFEVGPNWVARSRWQCSGGYAFPTSTWPTADGVRSVMSKITDFDDGRVENVETTQAGLATVLRYAGAGNSWKL